ncbi:hypothetical protein ACT80S_11100 [Ramlibacter sp. MAHUQ-53]|uniref:hypothetical protein n=1 Tax=unclassified Ramlibacter TaxID=2617605 RepID=UPI00362D2525
MTTFVHVDYSLQHPGVVRAERTYAALSAAGHGNLLLGLLALIGSPVVRLGQSLKAWRAARRLARADALYWETALGDARVMADISRAMSASAEEADAFWKVRA